MTGKQRKRSSLTVSYRDYLLASLRAPQEAAGYLNAVLMAQIPQIPAGSERQSAQPPTLD